MNDKKMKKKYKICSIGECMIEMSNFKENKYIQSFAGDTLNFLVYISRFKHKTSYLSAIGFDYYSNNLIKFFKKENISTKLLYKIKSSNLGLYLIKNNFLGEKEFYYWRESSPVRNFLNYINVKDIEKKLSKEDLIYFSGITLSLLNNNGLLNLKKIIKSLNNKNKIIVFDYNIRAKGWLNLNDARNQINKFLKYINIAFASGEDIKLLYGNNNMKNIKNIIAQYKLKSFIYRKNFKQTYFFSKNKSINIKNKILNRIVDSSGAGDAFNAAYISHFLNGNNIIQCLKFGDKIAKKNLMNKGAIVNDRF